jgi:hypothetical protein
MNPVINWQYSDADIVTFGVSQFMIQRKDEACSGPSTTYSNAGMVAASLRSFTDSNVVPGGIYCYRVVAIGAAGNSPPSNTAEKAVMGFPPAPTNVTVN